MQHIVYYIYMLLLCLFPIVLKGQSTSFSYQVIIESQNQYNRLDSKSLVNMDNRMGIDELSSTTKLYPVLTFESRFGDWKNTLQAEAFLTNYNFDKDSVTFSFQELYTRFSLKESHHWAIGKKRLDWGTGMVWNPTNFYIQKDPFRTQNRLEGIFLLSYTYLFSTSSLEFYVFPEKRMKDASYAAKYNYTGSRIDFSLSFLEYGRRQQVGYDITYGGDRFTLYSEGVIRNFSKSYRVGERGELIAPENKASVFHPEILAGGSYTFNAYAGVRFEYRFREDYLSKQEVKYLTSYLPQNLIVYDPVSIGKHSLYASADFNDMYGIYNLQLRLFYDIFSKQLIVSPLFVWKKSNFQIELSTMLFNNSLAVFDSQSMLLISCHF